MTVAPERAATLTELREIREALEDTNRLMARQVEEKVAEVSVPREELDARLRRSGKRVAVAIALIAVLLSGGVVLNRVTLDAARRDLSEQVATCFLSVSANTPAQTAACARRFGPDYTALQQRSRNAGADFVSLRDWAKQRGWKPPTER
jgi:hypothetical protein